MRAPGASFFLAVAESAVLDGCAQFGSPGWAPDSGQGQWGDSPQPIGPEALRPGLFHPGKVVVVLLPKANSAAGAVAVHSGGRRLLLDKPYAAAGVESAGRVRAFNYGSADAPAEFGAAIYALPGRPAAFTLYIHEGTDALTAGSEAEIARVFREIEARPDPEISVIGHTDAVGTDYYNDQLSLQRAQRVRSEIVNRGIPDSRIVVSGRGKREPLVATGQGIPEPKNRRVEINVR